MTDPGRRFAACSCLTAVQRNMCHHQLAYLFQQSCDPDAATRLIYKQLGEKFGYPGGCDEGNIMPVWEALRLQMPGRSEVARAAASGRHQPEQTGPEDAAKELQAPQARF